MKENYTPSEITKVSTTKNELKNTARQKLLLGVLIIVLVLFPMTTVYLIKDREVKDAKLQSSLSKQTTAQNSSATGAVETNSTASGGGYSTDTTQGYSTGAKNRIRTTLVLPEGYGIISQWPKTRSQSELNSYYATTFGDFIGHWNFGKKGSLDTPSSTQTREFTITSFTKWRKVADLSDYTYNDNGLGGVGPYSIAQKEALITDLKKRTADCATDTTRGFTTSDGVYKVCYGLEGQPQAEGADWVMYVEGYAEVGEDALYMRSYLDLPNSSKDPKAVQATFVDALKRIATVVDNNPSVQ